MKRIKRKHWVIIAVLLAAAAGALILFIQERQAQVKLLALVPRNSFLVVSTQGADEGWENARNSAFWKELRELHPWDLLSHPDVWRFCESVDFYVQSSEDREVLKALLGKQNVLSLHESESSPGRIPFL